MKLSIITCTYNSEKYLQECIDSVICQNLNRDDYEHIFIDGSSNDKTKDIIDKYINENPNKNIYKEERIPKGIYNAMNEGIKIAKGEYLLFLHSDDYLKQNELNNYLDFIEQTGNLDFYYAKFNAVDKIGKFIYNAPSRKMYQKGLNRLLLGFICYINQPTVIHKKDLHIRYGYFNENLKLLSDWEFWLKLGEHNISNIFYDKTMTNFRIHYSSSTYDTKNKKISQNEYDYLLREYFGFERYLMKFVNYLYKLI
ncbi:MAG: glycosyltransferase [Candidatus Gracilibacteria bacterium]|nr:glycosyltransferase [Candidatus Gracilibacteria bacterium]